MRRSKYMSKNFGDRSCVYVGVAKTSRKYNPNYYYCFARRTSDDKADKVIRLSSKDAAKVYRNEVTIEQILEKREEQAKSKVSSFNQMVSYHFYN